MKKQSLKRDLTGRILGYLRPYKWHVAASLVLSLLYVGGVLVGPVLYGEAIDAMLGRGKVVFSTVFAATAGFAGCVLVAALAQKLLGNCVNALCYRLVRDLRRDAFYSLTAGQDNHGHGHGTPHRIFNNLAQIGGIHQRQRRLRHTEIDIGKTTVCGKRAAYARDRYLGITCDFYQTYFGDIGGRNSLFNTHKSGQLQIIAGY